jgi:hypothetical protein
MWLIFFCKNCGEGGSQGTEIKLERKERRKTTKRGKSNGCLKSVLKMVNRRAKKGNATDKDE